MARHKSKKTIAKLKQETEEKKLREKLCCPAGQRWSECYKNSRGLNPVHIDCATCGWNAEEAARRMNKLKNGRGLAKTEKGLWTLKV